MKQYNTTKGEEEGCYALPLACTVDKNMPLVAETTYGFCKSCQCQCILCRGHLRPSDAVAEKTAVETSALFERILKAA